MSPSVEDLTDERELTDEEQANLAAMRRWNELYDGDDMEAFVRECYSPDYKLTLVDGTVFDASDVTLGDDVQAFIDVETLIKSECPGRRIVIERAIPAGNTVTLECALADDARPDFRLGWCGIYTLRDGLVVSDHSYLNHRDWPGLLKALGQE